MQTLDQFRATKSAITADEFRAVMECEPGDLTNSPVTALYLYKRVYPTYTARYVLIESNGRFEFWWGMGGTDYRNDLASVEAILFEGL